MLAQDVEQPGLKPECLRKRGGFGNDVTARFWSVAEQADCRNHRLQTQTTVTERPGRTLTDPDFSPLRFDRTTGMGLGIFPHIKRSNDGTQHDIPTTPLVSTRFDLENGLRHGSKPIRKARRDAKPWWASCEDVPHPGMPLTAARSQVQFPRRKTFDNTNLFGLQALAPA